MPNSGEALPFSWKRAAKHVGIPFVLALVAAGAVAASTDYHDPAGQLIVRWDDPDLGIEWPVSRPLLSDRDRGAPRLKDIPRDQLPGAAR